MEKTIEINGEKFYLRVVTGIALNARRERVEHRKLKVSGGDGGYVAGGMVKLAPIEIDEEITGGKSENFVLLGLDGVEHEFELKNEEHRVDINAGNIVSLVLGSKTQGGKMRPYIISNHDSRLNLALGAFRDAVVFSNLRQAAVGLSGPVVAFLFSLPWYAYIVLPVAALAGHYFYNFKLRGRLTARGYLRSEEGKNWLRSLGRNDDAYRSMVGQGAMAEQA